jgi:hypothetical protein
LKNMSLPVACSLIEPELQERRSSVLQKFRGAVAEVKETEEGYAYRLPSDGAWLVEIATMVDLERQCCPFLRFQIMVEPDGGPIWLAVSGPQGTKDFLGTVFN